MEITLNTNFLAIKNDNLNSINDGSFISLLIAIIGVYFAIDTIYKFGKGFIGEFNER
ncbi:MULTISPECIES: hypothetical protein [unclassified Clostridium]|uniref:hypothetical protein n=1 Tax=unclassified Clostridium TaxID=2614128 RepID=UPI001898A0AB|nr:MULTISPECIES: hypothetical protein [unclassified Clostridium]MBP3914889.1 hypothetical protein [Clostridium sp.]